MAPAAFQAFALDAHAKSFFGFQKVQADSTEPGEVFGAVTGANATIIIGKADVQAPV